MQELVWISSISTFAFRDKNQNNRHIEITQRKALFLAQLWFSANRSSLKGASCPRSALFKTGAPLAPFAGGAPPLTSAA
jgi:hypothetical protein